MLSRDNYEIWFVDYLDGNLNEKEVRTLHEFLTKNPDLKQELKEVAGISFTSEAITYPNKRDMHKHAFDEEATFNHACIKYVEHEMNNAEKAELIAYTQVRPQRNKVFSQFKKTVLQQENIRFPEKDKLYKKTIFVYWKSLGQVAAAILIACILSYGLSYERSSRMHQFSASHGTPFMHNTTREIPISMEKAPPLTETMGIPNSVKKTVNISQVFADQKERVVSEKATIRMEKLRPKHPRFKESVLVFIPSPLQSVDLVVNQPENKGLLASLFRRKTNNQELKGTARNLRNFQLAPSLLNLLGEMSDNKLRYKENARGDIAEIKYDSRMLSFSLPVRSSQD